MADAVITEHTGTREGPVARFYQYGREGVRVLDTRKNQQRLYLFDPSLDMMTERDPSRREKILRRFMFDQNGMLEETFSFGQRPRTFRYPATGIMMGRQRSVCSEIQHTCSTLTIMETVYGTGLQLINSIISEFQEISQYPVTGTQTEKPRSVYSGIQHTFSTLITVETVPGTVQ